MSQSQDVFISTICMETEGARMDLSGYLDLEICGCMSQMSFVAGALEILQGIS